MHDNIVKLFSSIAVVLVVRSKNDSDRGSVYANEDDHKEHANDPERDQDALEPYRVAVAVAHCERETKAIRAVKRGILVMVMKAEVVRKQSGITLDWILRE